MLRRVLHDSVIYSLSAILSRGMSVILIPLYTRILQPYEYGVFDLLMMFATLVSYLVSLEISQGLGRVYSDANNENEKRAYVSAAAWFSISAYTAFVVFSSAFSSDIARLLLGSEAWGGAVQVMIIAIAFNGIFFLLQDLLRWQLKPMRHALASILYSLTSATVGAIAVAFLDAGVVGILAGQICGAVVGFFIAWRSGGALYWCWEFNRGKWKEMAKYSTPQVISSLAAYLTLYVDRLFIKENLTLDEVGIYGVGARIASLVTLLMVGFQSSYIPIVFHNHAAPETPSQMARVFNYFLVGAIAIILLLSGFSREILVLLTTKPYYSAWDVIPFLATATLLANMYIFAPGIFIARRTFIVAGINLGALGLSIVCNIFLFPDFGVMGSAFAILFTSTIVLMVYFYFNARFYPIPFVWRRILTAVTLGVLMAAILFNLQTYNGLMVFLGKIALYLTCIAVLFGILVDKSDLKQAFSVLKISRK